MIPASSPTLNPIHTAQHMCHHSTSTLTFHRSVCTRFNRLTYHHHIQWHLQWHRSARVVVVASPIAPCTLISPHSRSSAVGPYPTVVPPAYLDSRSRVRSIDAACVHSRVKIGTPELYDTTYVSTLLYSSQPLRTTMHGGVSASSCRPIKRKRGPSPPRAMDGTYLMHGADTASQGHLA